MRRILLILVILTAACGGCDDTPEPIQVQPDVGSDAADTNIESDMGNDTADAFVFPDVDYEPQPSSVETQVLNPTLRAGEDLVVVCSLLDEEGGTIQQEADAFSILVAPEGSFEDFGTKWTATRTGNALVRCAHTEFGLVDETPVDVVVEPGAVARTAIVLDKNEVVAGDSVTATCSYFDAYGNAVPDVTGTLLVDPPAAGQTITGLVSNHETAGVYAASCSVPGAEEEQTELFEVVPGAPAQLFVSKVPEQNVYAQGQVVEVAALVTDKYGNEIENPDLSFESDPAGTAFGEGRFRYFADGTYTVTVSVNSAPGLAVDLEESVDIVVNGAGPAINCESPANGSMLVRNVGSSVVFQGTVTDGNGIQTLTVNGSSVTPTRAGNFFVSIPAQYGMNFVDISAVDSFGSENTKVCVFLSAPAYDTESTFLTSAITLRMAQAAVDDQNANDLDSLNDILHRVLNASALVDQIDTALQAANPLKPYSCDQSTFLGCILRSGVTYDGIQVRGPNSTTLNLVPGGLRAVATVRDIGLRNSVRYKIGPLPSGTTRGTVTVEDVRVDLTINVTLQNGQLSASVRTIHSVDVGGISTSYDGLDGAIINIVIGLFEGTVRNLVRDQIRNFIRDNFDQVLDDLFGGLDISGFGSSFDVPRLDSGTERLNFDIALDDLSVNSSRMQVGIGTRITGRTGQGRPSLGVALSRPPSHLYTGAVAGAIGVGVHQAVFNQVLHALWRAGYFDVTLSGADLGGSAPDDVSVQLVSLLPPVVKNLGGKATQLELGGLVLNLRYPGLFDDGLALDLGAIASTGVSLNGDELSFTNIQVDRLVFSTDSVSLDSASRALLENLLRQLVQTIVDSALNQSLPSLPIPTFAIPPSLSVYGLPANAELGITGATLTDTLHHFVLSGGFGVR